MWMRPRGDKNTESSGQSEGRKAQDRRRKTYARSTGERGIAVRKRGKTYLAEFDADLSASSLRAAFEQFLKQRKT